MCPTNAGPRPRNSSHRSSLRWQWKALHVRKGTSFIQHSMPSSHYDRLMVHPYASTGTTLLVPPCYPRPRPRHLPVHSDLPPELQLPWPLLWPASAVERNQMLANEKSVEHVLWLTCWTRCQFSFSTKHSLKSRFCAGGGRAIIKI